MTTLYPGGLDSYSTKVDGVTDVLAAHINDPQDAIEALEAQHQTRSLRKIKNGSGATVAANKIGYFDVAGDFVTTGTASLLASPWAAVISGGANNTQIVVGQGRVTIELTANCSIGDFLISSTTAGRAGVVAVWEEAVLAVALTANTGGAGGTCEAMLFPEIGYWVGFGVVVDELRAKTDDINFNDGQMLLKGSNGHLGIGITPAEILTLREDQNAATRLDIRNATAGAAAQAQLRIRNDNAGHAFQAGVTSTTFTPSGELGADDAFFQSLGAIDIVIRAVGAANIKFGTNATVRMYIKSDGNIGLNGVTNPSTELDIGAGAIEGDEMTDPGAGAANTYRLFAEDNGAGKTRLMARFATGAAQQIAIQP